ncbi:MAG: hypothetical protein M3Y87_21970 [Myxococcota bacterium]|nr:hypothetical protein [Myxococcota bacterium]
MRTVSMLVLPMLVVGGCYLSHERDASDAGAPPERVLFRALSAGDDHTCAIDALGRTWCWGFAQQGQLGLGVGDGGCELRITEGPIVDRPTRLPGGAIDDAEHVTAGGVHACVRTAGAAIVCWGGNCRGQLGTGDERASLTPARAVHDDMATGWRNAWAGRAHTCAIDRDARTWCWGANEYGQLGLGTMSPRSEPGATTPMRVDDLGATISAALGMAHTCALSARGEILCWGANGAGQLGDGTHELRSRPAPVMLPGAATHVTAGDRHGCGVVDGRAWCWGWNERGQLGDGVACAPGDEACAERPLPVPVALEGRIEQIDAGSQFTCAIAVGRGVLCWGANDVGQLGDGTSRSSASPVRVIGVDDAIELTAGANHACAIRRDRSVWCWGRNAQGQLGDGTLRDSAVPVRADPVIEEGG